MKKLKSFYPVLLVAFPILSFFGHNMDETPAADLVLPLIVAIAGVLGILLLLRLFSKSHNKIALILSLFITLFFSYGYVRDAIFAGAKTNLKPNAILLSVWLAIFIAGAFLVIKAHRDFTVLTKFLCIATAVLVVIALGGIGVGSLSLEHKDIDEHDDILELSSVVNPDIYYIVLDMYAGEDALARLFGFDNSEFLGDLSDRGFYVGSQSCSNYRTSYLSLSSSLNMDFIEPDNQLALLDLIKDSDVSKLLKSAGYQYIYVTGGVPLNGMERYADVYSYSGVFGIRVTAFTQGLCDTTMLSPLARVLGGLYGANSVEYAFDALSEIPDIEGPTFVYSHILCPHPPWFFESGGARVLNPFGPGQDEMVQEGYIGNLIFVNEEIEKLVDEILSKSDILPIIILQGDHGLWWVEEYSQHYQILNAYYLPGGGEQLLYESISPVNSFRVIFNHYFGMDYELLEDRLE